MSASLRICAASLSEMSFVALVSCVGLEHDVVVLLTFCRIVTNVPAVVFVHDIVVFFVRALVGGLFWRQNDLQGFVSDALLHVWNGRFERLWKDHFAFETS